MIQILSRMDVLLLVGFFRYYLSLKLPFRHISARKNLFFSACYIWNDKISLQVIDQKFPLSGLIGHGNSYLDSILYYSKVFRLHAILHDAAGAVRSHLCKGHGYYYMIGQGPNSCFLGHVTGLLFCLYVKNFVPSIFNSVDSRNRMCLIVLKTELTVKNIFKKLGLFVDGSPQRFSFCPPKTFKPNKQTSWNTEHLHGIVWSSGKLDYEKLFAVFYDIKVMNAEVFAKGLKKCRLLTRLLEQKVENLDAYGRSKTQDLVKTDSLWICSNYPLRHKTRLRCAERKAKVYGEWAMQYL